MRHSTAKRRPARLLPWQRFVPLLLVVGLVGSGCSLLEPDSPPASITAASPPSEAGDLAKYYQQEIAWSTCEGGLCGKLTVPLDYDDPTGETIQIAVLRAPAKDAAKRQGSLLVNPGGPGGSGVEYAQYADYIVGKPVRNVYDIVGFDPRGVARSAPITCVQPTELDEFLGGDPTPDDAAEEKEFADSSKSFADACGANAGPLLGHVSTKDAARDMDILRGALGDEQLTYLGKSYGTYLGATYAGLFPDRVRRLVLDGVVPPDMTNAEINLGQAVGFERATRAWAAACVEDGDCALGDSTDEVMTNLREFMNQLDAQPLTKTGDASVPALTEGWASLGIAAAMYDQGKWSTLNDAMTAAKEGDGAPLMELADSYAERRKGGTYQGNLMQAIYAVNCLDKPESDSIAEHAKQAKDALAEAPTWGDFLMWSSLPCGFWPVEATGKAEKITAAGSDPILVVGTTRDPATPYEWSVRLNDQLENSTLISYDGDGHTAYTRSNSCVDNAIDAYFVKGTVPEANLKC